MGTPGGAGDREKGSPAFTGPERGDRSDRALVLTLGPPCAHGYFGTFVGIPRPPQKIAAFLFPIMLIVINVCFCAQSVNNKVIELNTGVIITGVYMIGWV